MFKIVVILETSKMQKRRIILFAYVIFLIPPISVVRTLTATGLPVTTGLLEGTTHMLRGQPGKSGGSQNGRVQHHCKMKPKNGRSFDVKDVWNHWSFGIHFFDFFSDLKKLPEDRPKTHAHSAQAPQHQPVAHDRFHLVKVSRMSYKMRKNSRAGASPC